VSIPTLADRLAARLAELPDACRALLAALDRAQSRGGGDVTVRIEVGTAGVQAVELPTRYEALPSMRKSAGREA
jgi:hypothetical protein